MRNKLYYYNKKPNFGDMLNPFLIEKLFHFNTEYAHHYYADYFCIGSILERNIETEPTWKKKVKKILLPKITVFGSGFITEQTSENIPVEYKDDAVSNLNLLRELEKDVSENLNKIMLLKEPYKIGTSFVNDNYKHCPSFHNLLPQAYSKVTGR